ncbi:MAG: Coq4 family protein, partial [Cyclobacteriaceae bacterium]
FKQRKTPWGISRYQLVRMPRGTLGNTLGRFLRDNNFNLIPRLERHDAYHVLTGYGTDVKDEIALQFFCFGNGKRSKYLFLVMIFGAFLNPEHWQYFRSSYLKGKRTGQFYHLDFKECLIKDLKTFRRELMIDTTNPDQSNY